MALLLIYCTMEVNRRKQEGACSKLKPKDTNIGKYTLYLAHINFFSLRLGR